MTAVVGSSKTKTESNAGQRSGPRLSGLRRKGPGSRSPARGRAAALLLVAAGFALGFAWLYANAGEKADVLAVRAPVPAGQVLQRVDLTTAAVAGSVPAVPVAEAGTVVGKTTTTRLVPGQLVVPQMVTAEPVPGPGQALVGLSLAPSQMPADGLAAGDVVTVLAVGSPAAAGEAVPEPSVLVESATVHGVHTGNTAAAGSRQVTVLVPDTAGPVVAAHAAAERVAVIETAPQPDAQDGGAG